MVTIKGYYELYGRPIPTYLLTDPTFDETGSVEPVDLNTAKRHLRITFTDDDAMIGDIIKAARMKVEKRHNKSLVMREVSVTLSNGGKIELPYGPIHDYVYVNDVDGENVEFTEGGGWLTGPVSDHLKVVYTAGYTPTTIPADLKREVLEEIAYMYRHAGDEGRENKSSKSWIV